MISPMFPESLELLRKEHHLVYIGTPAVKPQPLCQLVEAVSRLVQIPADHYNRKQAI